jgi:hypothetical protein
MYLKIIMPLLTEFYSSRDYPVYNNSILPGFEGDIASMCQKTRVAGETIVKMKQPEKKKPASRVTLYTMLRGE